MICKTMSKPGLKYLFFPFTHISEDDLNAILSFFPQLSSLYLNNEIMNNDLKNNTNLNQLYESGKFIPDFLHSQLNQTVEHQLKQFLEWSKLHKGNENNLKLLYNTQPCFTKDSDVTSLKSQIKANIFNNTIHNQGSVSCERESSPKSSLLKNLLFLKMAQLHDEQNEDIDFELNNINKTNERIVSDLLGTNTLNFCNQNQNQISRDSATGSKTVMIRERIYAWFKSVAALKIISSNTVDTLFITTYEEVFNFFEFNCKNIINILDIANIKVHESSCKNKTVLQDQFEICLADALKRDDYCKKKMMELIDLMDLMELMELNDKGSGTASIKICNFFMDDIEDDIGKIINSENKYISICLIKLK